MYTIVGFKNVTAKATGKKFVELHTVSDDRFVNGQRCDTIFVSLDQIENLTSLEVGAICQVVYNRLGRVDSIVIL